MSTASSSPPSKASLLKWWKIFSSRPTSPPSSSKAAPSQPRQQTSGKLRAPAYRPPGRGLSKHEDSAGKVFGVALEQSLRYASVAISAIGPDGNSYVYGYVPIVVAKCGMMLKETATATEGIFRVSGSNKRINQLQQEFDTPPRYGKDLDWTGYSQHDAASVLRRYLNSMPDPVIPQDLYHLFTSVLQQDLPHDKLISSYKHLITLLPPSSRYLLLYLLDFLSVFARLSSQNLMTASNLAVVFQPGLVSSRREGDAADLLGFPGVGAAGERGKGEHGKGKEVLEFLIEQQEQFMVGLEIPERIPHNLTPAAPQTTPISNTSSAGLTRKGSEKSVERRRARVSTKNSEAGSVSGGREGNGKVKRSRTLPGRKSDVSSPVPSEPAMSTGQASITPTKKKSTS